MTQKHAKNRMPKKLNDFGLKYGNQKHNEKAEWINNMTRELEDSKKARERKYTSIYSKRH